MSILQRRPMIYALGTDPSALYHKSFTSNDQLVLTSLHDLGYNAVRFPYFRPCLVACVVGRAMVLQGVEPEFLYYCARE